MTLCYAKALVLQAGKTTAVLVTVDAVAIGEIGRPRNDFLAKVRREIAQDPRLKDAYVIINASHCHGIIHDDTDQLVVQAIRERSYAQHYPTASSIKDKDTTGWHRRCS